MGPPPMTTEDEFLSALQQRIADIAAGTSTLRGQVTGEGKIIAVQQFLGKQVNLRDFATADGSTFRKALDLTTDRLVSAVDGLKWGSARKSLNVFLRDCLYDRFITDRIDLQAGRPHMEIPLDGQVGKWLREQAEARRHPELPPRWNTIVGITSVQNEQYQRTAARVANEHPFELSKIGLERVDLDVLVWRQLGADATASP